MLIQESPKVLGIATAKRNARKNVLQSHIVHSDLRHQIVFGDRHVEFDFHLVAGTVFEDMPDRDRARNRFALSPADRDRESPAGLVLRGVEARAVVAEEVKENGAEGLCRRRPLFWEARTPLT